MAAESGVDAQTLADALPRETDRRKGGEASLRAVKNWLAGRDHPRCGRREIEAMAGVLGVEPTAIARFVSVARFQRSSPQKARLVVDMIRGRAVDEAETLLSFSPKRASMMVRKALLAAMSDAEEMDASLDRLVVSEARADEGVIIKRFRPKDRGRAHPIQKKTSHITVGLEERG